MKPDEAACKSALQELSSEHNYVDTKYSRGLVTRLL